MNDKTWSDYVRRWRSALGEHDLIPAVATVDVIVEDIEKCHTRARSEATWWLKSSLARYPTVSWTWDIGPMLIGEHGHATRTSVDFPRQPSAVLAVARTLTRTHDEEALCAIMTMASCRQRHRNSSRIVRQFGRCAEDAMTRHSIPFHVNPMCDRYLPIRIERMPENEDEIPDWLIEEHVANLETWNLVAFRPWLLKDGSYREMRSADMHSRKRHRFLTQTDEEFKKERDSKSGRDARKPDEILLQEAIGDYLGKFRIDPGPIRFGAKMFPEKSDILCDVDGNLFRISRKDAIDEPKRRGGGFGRSRTFERQITQKGERRVDAVRNFVHEALEQYVRYDLRFSVICAESRSKEKTEDRLPRVPLWAMEIHPIARALHPDIGGLIRLDPENVRLRFGQEYDTRGSGRGRIQIEGSRLILKDVNLDKGIEVEQDGRGIFVSLTGRSIGGPTDALIGREISEFVEGAPEGVRIRTAKLWQGNALLKIDDAWVPAADIPDRWIRWQECSTIPESWAGTRRVDNKKPKKQKTPILHRADPIAWRARTFLNPVDAEAEAEADFE